MNPDKLRVAVATKDGIAINEHFGHVKAFYIYDIIDQHQVKHIETREVPHYCLGGHSDKAAMGDILDTIADCKAVLVAKIGDGPTEKLNARGIQAITQYTWEEILPALRDFGTKYQETSLG